MVAATGGINVWCAAKGGTFTAHSVVSVVKTSEIGDKVTNRTLILPQLAAPGIDTNLVRKELGWNCRFGPVYAKDIPEYIADGLKKTDAMRRVKWTLFDRLEIGLGIYSPLLLTVMVILAIFLRAWLVEFAVLIWGLLLLIFGFYPLIPGKAGWHKLLFLEALTGIGLLGCIFLEADQTGYIRDLLVMAMGLILVIGADFGGVTPLYKSDLDPLLDKLRIGRIGPVDFNGRAEIIGGKIVLDQTTCTACGICYDVCPTGVYDLVEDNHKRVLIKYPELCQACEACVLQCPKGALSFVASSGLSNRTADSKL